MFAKSLAAVIVAVFFSTASTVLSGAISPVHAQVTVRPEVGNPLNEASGLASKGNYTAALAKVKEAENVSGKTAAESQAIAQMKQYIAGRSGNFGAVGGVNSAGDAKAKLTADYNARRYRDVIADAELLRKYGAYDYNAKLLVAQAYYLSGDNRGAIRVLETMGDSEQVLSLLMAAAHKSGDTAAEQDAASRLVARGQTKYWSYLLTAAEKTTGLKNDHRLAIARVRFLTGNMRNASDYHFLAEQALQLGYAQEALKVVTRGFANKVLADDRAQRLFALARREAAADQAKISAAMKQADASANGEASVKVAENLWGYGKMADAVKFAQSGIDKGVVNQDAAHIVLGIAQTGSGQTSAALRAFNSMKDDKYKAIARLWSVYARSPSSGSINSLLGGNVQIPDMPVAPANAAVTAPDANTQAAAETVVPTTPEAVPAQDLPDSTADVAEATGAKKGGIMSFWSNASIMVKGGIIAAIVVLIGLFVVVRSRS